MVFFTPYLSNEVGYYIGRLIHSSKLEEHNIVKMCEIPYVVFRLGHCSGVKKWREQVQL